MLKIFAPERFTYYFLLLQLFQKCQPVHKGSKNKQKLSRENKSFVGNYLEQRNMLNSLVMLLFVIVLASEQSKCLYFLKVDSWIILIPSKTFNT